jgi:hypothetical protein
LAIKFIIEITYFHFVRAGVQDRFVDAFCGRLPVSVLARRYRLLSDLPQSDMTKLT